MEILATSHKTRGEAKKKDAWKQNKVLSSMLQCRPLLNHSLDRKHSLSFSLCLFFCFKIVNVKLNYRNKYIELTMQIDFKVVQICPPHTFKSWQQFSFIRKACTPLVSSSFQWKNTLSLAERLIEHSPSLKKGKYMKCILGKKQKTKHPAAGETPAEQELWLPISVVSSTPCFCLWSWRKHRKACSRNKEGKHI